MIRIALTAMLILSLVSGLALAVGLDDVKTSASCKYCGMDREKFGHSRMLITYDDGSTLGTCSLHCVATELATAIDKAPRSIQVADYDTRELLDAETAIWVLGGSKGGVMSSRAKWAFGSPGAAERFIKDNGGTIITFDDAMKAAYEDMYQDTKMIRERRKLKRLKQQTQGAPK